MSELRTRTLGEICDEIGGIIRTGPFGSQLHQSDYTTEGLPVIMPKDMLDGKVSTEDIARIGPDDEQRLHEHKLSVGDIVYARRGDIGRRALITDREDGWLCGTGSLRISLGNKVIDPIFLFYYLGDPIVVAKIQKQAVGATMPNLNSTIVRNIEITYPPISTQRKIAGILSAYDDLIENNTRRIRLLEQMAQAVYREWFVHFRFPGHEGEKVVEGLPEGWEIKRFTDVIDVMSGGTPKTTEPNYWGNEIPWFTPQDISKTIYVLDTERKITSLGLSKCNSKLYPADTVFITARGTVGKVVMAAVPMAMSQTSYALLGQDEMPQYYVYLLTLSLVEQFKKNATGAVFDTIIVDTFRGQMVTVPPKSVLTGFSRTVKPIFSMIQNLQKKNANLRQTRDLLLPRLVGGEGTVHE